MYAIVLELDTVPGGPRAEPELLATARKWEDAKRIAQRAAFYFWRQGGKIAVSKVESTDQLQSYGPHRDQFIRDQPDLPAIGEDRELYQVEPAKVIVPEHVMDKLLARARARQEA